MIGRSHAPPSSQELPWMEARVWAEMSVAACLFVCFIHLSIVQPWGTGLCSRPSSTLWAGLWLGSVSFRQKGFWPLGRELRTPCLHSLGRGLWSIPRRVVRRGVAPAVALPSQWSTVGAGTRYLCCAHASRSTVQALGKAPHPTLCEMFSGALLYVNAALLVQVDLEKWLVDIGPDGERERHSHAPFTRTSV